MTYQIPVDCNGFRALVTMKGRILLEQTQEEAWIYGVNPSGIAVSGRNHEAALNAWTKALHAVIFDLAKVAKTFVEFKKEFSEAFKQGNEEYGQKWEEALKQVREQGTELAGLPKKPGNQKPSIRILRIAKPKPSQNPKEEVSVAQPAFPKAA